MDYDELLEKYKNNELAFSKYSNVDDLVEETYNNDHDFINALFEQNGLDTNQLASDYDVANDRYVSNAKLAMQKAIQLHNSSNVPAYANYFVLNDYVKFDDYLNADTIDNALNNESPSYNYAKAREIFQSESPEAHPEFLETIYDGIDKMLYLDGGFFFVDRGNDYAIATDSQLVDHADELVNVYELVKNADELIEKVQTVQLSDDPKTSEKQKAQQEEIIERLNMVKAQKRFLEDDLMRLECLGNKYASHFDLSSMDTIKFLSDTYEKITSEEANFEIGNTENDKEFTKLCKSCHERWTHAAEAELEAAETLISECEGANNIMMHITENGQEIEIPFDRERAKTAFLKSKPEDKFQIFFNKQNAVGSEKIALDLSNNGKQAWAKYKVQIDCDCNSLDVNKLPKDPGFAKKIWHKVLKFFKKEGLPEVEEYNNAKSRLQEISNKIKEHIAKKKKAAAGKESLINDELGNVEKDLIAEAQRAKEHWEKVGKGEYATFMQEWEQMSQFQRNENRQKAIEWANLKKKWDEAPESEKQKSKITSLRSSKILQQRKIKNEIKIAEKRDATKEQLHNKLSAYMKEAFNSGAIYEQLDQTLIHFDDIHMLIGKDNNDEVVDYKKVHSYYLKETINHFEQAVQKYKDNNGNLHTDKVDALVDLVLSNTRDSENYPDARAYYAGYSELEKFDEIYSPDKKLPDASKLSAKRKLDFGKAVISEVEKKIQEFKDYLPEAEVRDFKETLKNRYENAKHIKIEAEHKYDFSRYDKVINECIKKYPEKHLEDSLEYKAYMYRNKDALAQLAKKENTKQTNGEKGMKM